MAELHIADCYYAHAPLYRDGDVAYISPCHAMQSAAGWYAGSWCISAMAFDDGTEMLVEPYDRVSGYYATQEEAQSYADWLNRQ